MFTEKEGRTAATIPGLDFVAGQPLKALKYKGIVARMPSNVGKLPRTPAFCQLTNYGAELLKKWEDAP